MSSFIFNFVFHPNEVDSTYLFFPKVIDYDFVRDPMSSNITSGNTLLLYCTPPHSYPSAVTITWYKDYERLVLGGAISVTAEHSLRISSITRSAEGVYFCQAYNPSKRASRTSRTATISVRGLFTFSALLLNYNFLYVLL